MKKILLGLIISLSLSVSHGQTNIYHPFPDSNAIWCDSTCGLSSWEIKGDTIVNSIVYHKLFYKENLYPLSISQLCEYYNPAQYSAGYAGAIRQDIAGRKVYFLDLSSNADTLLYDFTSGVGDTVRTYLTEWAQDPTIITILDSILIGTDYRKKWTLYNSSTGYFQIIEGIGTTKGPIENLVVPGGYRRYDKLYCFSHNNQILYPQYISSSACKLVTGVFENSKLKYITFSPNPFSTQTTLQTNIPLHNAILMVYNSFGQTVAQIKNISGQTITFNRENLPSGLYFLRLTEDKKIYTDKLIITDK